jgi:surfactin synthase thioesterase subunit
MTGEHDNYVSRAQMMEWSRYTDSDFQIFVRPGSHFLMAENPEFIVGTMNRELRVVEKRERADVA